MADQQFKFKTELSLTPIVSSKPVCEDDFCKATSNVSKETGCQDSCCQAITSDPNDVSQTNNKVAQKLGYSIESNEPKGNLRTYNIQGMDCSSCALTIEKHMRQIPNVKNVSVNFSSGKMRIEHESSIEDIIKEVSKAGYMASFISKKGRNIISRLEALSTL